MKVKVDSYVLETNVHHPTDCNLLWDGLRKCLVLSHRLSDQLNLSGYRKWKFWKKRAKAALRHLERIAYRGGPSKDEALQKATQDYLQIAREIECKTIESIKRIQAQALGGVQLATLTQLVYFKEMVTKHIDLVKRRLVEKEVIPHNEKVFSLFEPHTELIKKGKRRPPIEFGHRLMIASEQHGLILDYKVIPEGGGESAEVESLIERLNTRYGKEALCSLSTDRGFSCMATRKKLQQAMGDDFLVVMPKKGKASESSRERESEERWRKLQDAHSAVESDINALEHTGLDRCPDKGKRGYERYAGLGVLAYNLRKIGKALLAQKAKRILRIRTGPLNKAA